MERLHVKFLNNTYMKLDADSSLLYEVKDYFTFEVPGAKFHPKVKMRIWDGKISMLNLPSCTMYVGLLSKLKKFCKERGYEIIIDEELEQEENVTLKEIVDFVKSLDLRVGGNPIVAKDYQIASVYYMIKKRRLTLLSPTSSGKSLIIYICIRWLLAQDKDVLLIVPNVGLTGQMFSDFDDYSTANGFDVQEHCQVISAGMTKDVTSRITISTWQSVYKLQSSWFNQFDAIICDEVHLAQANSIRSIMEKATDVKWRWGLTGTLNGSKVHEMVIEGLFGEVKKIVTTSDLIEQGHVSDIDIVCVVFKYSDKEECKIVKKSEYAAEMNYISKHKKRNQYIAKMAANTKGNTLILYQYIEHGELLYELISQMVEENRKVFLINGSVDGDVRNEIRTVVEQEEDAIIIASYGTTSTGTNIRRIHTIIAASPTKSIIRLLQSIGRGLRKAMGKSSFKWIDIVDDFSGGSAKKNTTYNHFAKRLEIYVEQGFNYKIHELII